MKKVLNILKKIIYAIVMLCIFITPFLHKIFDQDFAEIIFYFSIGVFIVVTLFDKDNDLIENCLGTIYICFLFISFFVINYYNTKYNWLWFIFILMLLLIIGGIFLYNKYIKKSEKLTDKLKNSIKKLFYRYCFMFVIADLFYMSFLIHSTFLQIVFGIILLVDDLYNLSKAFLINKEKYIYFLLFDFVVAIFTTVFLIFIIPDKELQNIVISLVSAIYGGLLTLVGVAWTIKKSNDDKNETLILSVKPILYSVNYKNIDSYSNITYAYFYKDMKTDNRRFIGLIKNTDNGIFILKEAYVNDEKYLLNFSVVIEKNNGCEVYLEMNNEALIEKMIIVGTDVMGNNLKFQLILKKDESNIDAIVEIK